jgi:DNA (cytosine-5)-methyltransferase 1
MKSKKSGKSKKTPRTTRRVTPKIKTPTAKPRAAKKASKAAGTSSKRVISVLREGTMPAPPQSSLFVPAPRRAKPAKPRKPFSAVGLFAGIGGIELGLARAGHHATLLCENEPGAVEVLRERFPGVPVHQDVRDLRKLPKGTELLAGGFPCQDLSQAGMTAGIRGEQSGLVDEIFRLLRTHDVPWLLLENVPFMLQLHQGQALDHIVTALEELGYAWAYRVVDSRSMGLPQRRERVYIVASKVGDPRDVLLVDEADAPAPKDPDRWREVACGFYWTEGLRGLGWAYNAVPTLKGGSTIGIPSPPAIVLPSGEIVQPDIRDAERLQGFDADWTTPSDRVQRSGHRWKLVGNAVTVDVAAWIGRRLLEPGQYDPSSDVPLLRKKKVSWPRAAWGVKGERWISFLSAWPERRKALALEEFLRYPTKLLSERAAAGFYSRAKQAKLRFPPGFLDLVAKRANGSLHT